MFGHNFKDHSISGPESNGLNKNSQHPNTGQVRFSNGRFVSGCQMVLLSNAIRITEKLVRFSDHHYKNRTFLSGFQIFH